MTGAQLYGGTRIATAAGDFAHAATVVSGENWSLESSTTDVWTLSINGSDYIKLNGTTGAIGKGLTSTGVITSYAACQYWKANYFTCYGAGVGFTP